MLPSPQFRLVTFREKKWSNWKKIEEEQHRKLFLKLNRNGEMAFLFSQTSSAVSRTRGRNETRLIKKMFNAIFVARNGGKVHKRNEMWTVMAWPFAFLFLQQIMVTAILSTLPRGQHKVATVKPS